MIVEVADFIRLRGDVEALRQLVVAQLEYDPLQVARLSRETTTHYKWMLASDQMQGTTVWLHEFKSACERRSGFATTVHNHRYPFTAIVLSGGYTNLLYEVSFDPRSLHVERCEVIERRQLGEGLAYSMEPDEFHALDDIQDGTKTLIMEFAAVNAVSFSYDLIGDRMTKHLTLEARLRDLLQRPALLVGSSRGSMP